MISYFHIFFVYTALQSRQAILCWEYIISLSSSQIISWGSNLREGERRRGRSGGGEWIGERKELHRFFFFFCAGIVFLIHFLSGHRSAFVKVKLNWWRCIRHSSFNCDELQTKSNSYLLHDFHKVSFIIPYTFCNMTYIEKSGICLGNWFTSYLHDIFTR